MNRREALRSLAAGSAAGALPGGALILTASTPAGAEVGACPVLAAIEEHRRRCLASEEAFEIYDGLCAEYEAGLTLDPIAFPTSLGPMIYNKTLETRRDVFGKFTPVVFQDARAARIIAAAKAGGMTQERIGIVDGIYRDDIAAWAIAVHIANSRWAAIGASEAGLAFDAADDGALAAWDAFLKCPAETIAAVRTKVAYVLSQPETAELLHLDRDAVPALLRSFQVGVVQA